MRNKYLISSIFALILFFGLSIYDQAKADNCCQEAPPQITSVSSSPNPVDNSLNVTVNGTSGSTGISCTDGSDTKINILWNVVSVQMISGPFTGASAVVSNSGGMQGSDPPCVPGTQRNFTATFSLDTSNLSNASYNFDLRVTNNNQSASSLNSQTGSGSFVVTHSNPLPPPNPLPPSGGSGANIIVTSNVFTSWVLSGAGTNRSGTGTYVPYANLPPGQYAIFPDSQPCYSGPTITKNPADGNVAAGNTLTFDLNYTTDCGAPPPPPNPPPSSGVVCGPRNQNVLPNGAQVAHFTATGGFGPYSWSVSPSAGVSPSTGSGSTFDATFSFSNPSNYTVTIVHGTTDVCNVTVTSGSGSGGGAISSGGAQISCSVGGSPYTGGPCTTPGAVSIAWSCTGSYTFYGRVTDTTGNSWDSDTAFGWSGTFTDTLSSGARSNIVYTATCIDNDFPPGNPQHSSSAPVTAILAGPPPTVDLTGSKDGGNTWSDGPLTVNSGDPVKLRYSSSNASSCTTSSNPAGWAGANGNSINTFSNPDTVNPVNSTVYKVVCSNIQGASAQDTVSVGIGFNSPTNLTLSPTCGTITLNWSYVNSGQTGFMVYRGTSQGGETVLVNPGPLDAAARSYPDNTVVQGNRYFYYVTAYKTDAGTQSFPSNEVNLPVTECRADLGLSQKNITFITRTDPNDSNDTPARIGKPIPYASGIELKPGDILTFRITITNGPNATANANIPYVCDKLTDAFDINFGINGIHLPQDPSTPGGKYNGIVYNDPSPLCNGSHRFKFSGSVAPATNWVVDFEARLKSTSDTKQTTVSNTAIIKYSDGSSNCPNAAQLCSKTVTTGTLLFLSNLPKNPVIKEVAP